MRFQPHARTSEQRRRRFQESGPPGLQDPDAISVAGGGAWPGDQWAADVTNVVKPTQFKLPHEDPCYKRRQSKHKNQHFQRKSRWIDDVCNNTRCPVTPTGSGGARLRCPWAAAGPSQTTNQRTEQHQRPGTTGVEGAGGSGGHGRASRRGAERSEDA